MSRQDHTAPDITVEYDGDAVSYNLAEVEGVKQWFPTYLDEVPSENRSTPSAFSYNDAPRTISQVLDFADWSLGCGYVDAPPGTASFGGYSYSRGVDASEGRLILSPQLQALTNSVSSFDGMYDSPTWGAYGWHSGTLYHLQGGDWVQVYSDSAAITDLKEYGNGTDVYLFLAKGTAADVVYSTDGFAGTTTVTDFKTFKFTVRGNTSVEPVFWAVTQDGLLRSSTNPVANGNWSNTDRIGSAGETVTAMVTANDIIWIFKEEGYYSFDGTNVGAQVPVDQLKRPDNGKATLIWLDGFIYTNYGNRILKINPFENSTEVLLAPAHPEIKGAFTACTADTRWLYYFIQDPASSDTYCLKISPTDGTAHTFFYLAAQATINSALVVAYGHNDGPSTTNNLLMFNNGSNGSYVTLARDGRRPWEDDNYRFDPAGGFLVGPNVDAGVPTYEKWVNGAKELTESTTAARSVALAYDLDAMDSYSTILTALASGITEEQVSTEITFLRLRYKATLATGDNEHSPRVVAIMFNTTPNPPRYRAWRLVLDVADQQRRQGGGEPRGESYRRLLSHINGAVGKRVTYTDYFGDTFIAKVMTVAVQGVSWVPSQGTRGTAKSNIEVVIAEISENDHLGSPFIWDESLFDEVGEWS